MRQEKSSSHNAAAAVQAAVSNATSKAAAPTTTTNSSSATDKPSGEMHRVFVYGTLKSKEPNAHVIAEAVEKGHARFVCRAQTIDRYPLLIASRYNIPFLLYHPGEGKNVRGEIYEVSDETLAMLDDFEGHPEVYLRQSIKTGMLFDLDDDSASEKENNNDNDDEDVIVECWTYFLYDFEPSLLLRQHEFLENYSNHDPTHGLYYVTSEDIDEDYDELSALKAG